MSAINLSNFIQKIFLSLLLFFIFQNADVHAACGGTLRTWKGNTTSWGTNGNWIPSGAPSTGADDPVIISTGFSAILPAGVTTTVGCVDVQSGIIDDGNAASTTLSVTGTYFQAPYSGTLNLQRTSTVIQMAGTAAQTFEAVDKIQSVTVTNTTSVTYKNNFTLNGTWTLPSSGTTYITGTMRLTGALDIPAGHTVIIQNGGALFCDNNLTINGTLQVDGGAELRMANARTLAVNSGGLLKGIGSSGNSARIASYDSVSLINFDVAGSLSANYLVISGLDNGAKGINVTGTILQFNNTDIRRMKVAGMTLGSSAIVPSSFTTVGFYDDGNYGGTINIDATNYSGAVVTVSNYSGDTAGEDFDLDNSNKISWGTAAATSLGVINYSGSGIPTSITSASVTQPFAAFSFALNNTDVATNITQVVLTMDGTGTMSDLASVKAYKDNNQNCVYDAGSDTQFGANLSFSGSPPKATITIPSGDIQTNSTDNLLSCMHIIATTSATPSNGKTIGFSIISSSDITNSQNYGLSPTSGTPISASGYTTLTGTPDAVWTGGNTSWNTAGNWSTAAVPTSAKNCQVGAASRIATSNVNPMTCANATLASGGSLDYNGTANSFDIYAGLSVSSNFSFLNATTGVITMKGTNNQTIALNSAFPGNVIINNTGAAGSNVVDLAANSTINGNLTCTKGVMSITQNNLVLTVLGNVTIQTGCTLKIGGGGTLRLGAGKTLTVDAGGTLELAGTSALKATITSDAAASAYNVIVNGTIKARYYTFDHLNTAGVSIEAGASIDATNYMQDGSFTYPVNNSSTLLFLKRQIPGNTLTTMNFDLAGSAATGTTNINTTGAAAGTLTISSHSGNLSGATFHVQPTYLISWGTLANTISITQEATSPTSLIAGQTYNMGRFGFKQDAAGAFLDANITTLALGLTGTGSATDIAAVRLYRDTACSGASGTLIGSGSFSGNPAKVTFTITPGDLVVLANATTTVKVCAYVEYDIASGATDASTVGVQIISAADFVNSQTYAPSNAFPLTLGAAGTISVPISTTWTGGAGTTAWLTAGNWSNGVPTSALNCIIPVDTIYPVVSTIGPACASIDIQGGNLTINASSSLDIYGDFTHSVGTLTNNGTLTIKDSGSNNHYITSTPTLASINLAAVGKVFINNSNTTITNLGTMSSTTILTMANGAKLVLPNGYNLTSGTIRIEGGGTLEIGNAQTLSVAGGTFQIAGTNDLFPQNHATKGVIQVTGGGTNSFGFTATSGTVDLTGFQFDRLNTSGLNIGGTTTLSNLSGGQFTNLSTTYASVKAIQLNTSGTIPATATNIAWNWGNFNTFTNVNPTSAQTYQLVSSTGCGSQTIAFSGWTGDWYEMQPSFDVTTKISTVPTCTITMSGSSSAVSLLSFTAVPYNAAVDVRWETNAERNHLGFNIYRTTDGATNFLQINDSLIRNLKTSTSNRGIYRFIDRDVTNDKNYYYYLEDVDINGRTTMHGPVFAAPFAILGNPPADGISENSDTNTTTPDQGGTPSTIPNPTYQDLGNGIVILSQTSKSLRIEITPPSATFAASSWSGAYQDVIMAGYSKMTAVGAPELPEKDMLIEVQRFATTATVNKTSLSTIILNNHLISPAPSYALSSSGVLVPSYAPDTVIYTRNAFYPSQTYPLEFYGIEPNLITINEKKFLKLKINPMRFNPVSGEIKSASKIVLDIGLDGDDWDVTPPDVTSDLGPYSVANTLRVDYEKNGVYQINFSDFVNSQVEGPFANTDTSLWRVYYKDAEIPLEIYSPTGYFSNGDYVRFYAPFTSSNESKNNQIILSPQNLTDSMIAPKRISVLDSNPEGREIATDILTTFTKTFEQNLVYVDGFTLGDDHDHYFYQNLYSAVGGDTFSLVAPLPEIDNSNYTDVTVKYYVRGQLGVFGLPVKHRALLSLAGNVVGEAIFTENERLVLTFKLPANLFSTGNNTLELKVPGTFATVGDYDRILVDRVEIVYNGKHASSSGISNFSVSDQLRVYEIDKFLTNAITAYDITSPLAPKKLSNMNIALDTSGVTYGAKFFLDENIDRNYEKHFSFINGSSFLKPSALSLNSGANESLKNSANKADLIIYGEENLLVAAEDLIAMRKAQGLEVKIVTPEQVYSEFSYGVTKSQALRKFITTALSNWSRPPRFLLILGDGTNDPKDFDVNGLATANRASLERGTLPAPLIAGQFVDFSSDNYFVSSDTSHLPRLSVGRIPTNNPEKIKAYIEKIKRYEDGGAAPLTSVRNISFFADKDTAGNYEHFNQISLSMMTAAEGFNNTLLDRAVLGSDNLSTAKINDQFNAGPLMISLVGHGSPDRFGANIFTINNAATLSNNIYPIVATWNCENAYFYDADKTMKSFGEELIFNADGGAIVFMGSTTQITPVAAAKLGQNFYDQLSSVTQKPWDGTRLGDILYQAKIGVGAGSSEKDIVNSFSIIGDPSLMLPPNLFPESPYVAAVAAPAASKKKGLFGCSANASSDASQNSPWHEGFLEWLIYMSLIVYGTRKILRMSRI